MRRHVPSVVVKEARVPSVTRTLARGCPPDVAVPDKVKVVGKTATFGVSGNATTVANTLFILAAQPFIVALLAITAGTLYQRRYCPTIDLRPASLVQFAASLVLLAPLAYVTEGAPVQWSWALAGAVAIALHHRDLA